MCTHVITTALCVSSLHNYYKVIVKKSEAKGLEYSE